MDALDLIEVVADMLWLGQRVLNVYHLAGDQALDDSDVLTDVAEYMDDLYLTVDQLMSDALTFGSIIVRNLTQEEVLGEVDWPTLVNGGSTGANQLMSQAAGLVTFPTAIPKRRGRKFVPGFNEANLSSGLFDATLVSALEDFGEYLITPHSMTSGAGWRYLVWNGVIGVNSVSQPTEAIVTNVPSTLSRRRIGAGE